jgi:hypothetical protein
LTVARRGFDCLAGGCRIGVERLDPQRPLAVDQHEPAGAEVAPVDEQIGRLVGLDVEVHDRALRHADDIGGGHLRAPDLRPDPQRHVEQRGRLEGGARVHVEL